MSFWSAVGKFFLDVGTAVIEYAKNNPVSFGLQSATLIVGVKGFMQAKQMMAKGQDILANKTSAGGKLPVIYGTRRVGAQIVYMDVSANDSRDLYVVYALSVGECDEIIGRTIELDGNPLTDSARFRDGGYIGSDKISSGSGSLNTVSQNGTGINAGAGQFGSSPTSKYRYVMNLHHGAATQTADPMLVASMPNWTSAHKLNGVAYIAAHYGYDKEGIWSGIPQLTVQVRGKKVFDPRDTNQTFGTVSTYKYSDNPALTFLDYITNNEYGKGLTQSQINMSTFTAAANVCDTKVDQPYFNGTAQSLTWSGNVGDDFITIGGTDPNTNWWQNKIGEVIDIRDGSNTLIVDSKEIKDVQRNGFYDQNNEYIVYINDTLGSTYSSQAGTSLVKVKRFHCNGYLDANKNVMDNAKELLANMRGIFLYIDGKYELSIEDTGTATFNITDDHIISDTGISVNYGKKDKKANKVIVEFYNANKKYELDTATVLHDATPEYYSDDGDEILEIKAEFPYISDPYIAYNMGKAILTRSRKQMTIQFLGTPEMYKLNVGDIVTLSYAGTFDTVQTCRVEALELEPNGLVAVSLIEYFDVYTWETPPEEPLEELANLPSAYAVKAPTGLSFTDSSSSSTGRPILSWDAPTDYPDYEFRVNVVDDSGNQLMNRIVNTTFAELNFTPTGINYVASVTSLNTLGTESDAETETFSVSDEPVGLGDIRADAVTANTIDVNELSAITANLGAIDAGSIDIGSGNFTVSTAGLMTATGAIVTGEVNATSGTFNGSIAIGSGNNIFKADTNGIYLGNTSYASALFKVSPAGVVQSNKRITSGTGITQATLSGEDDTYRFWSGGTSGSTADFSVSKTGEIIAKKISIYNNEGGLIFSSDAGFSDLALTQISAVTGTPVQSVSDTFSANGDTSASWQSITLVANTNLSVSVALNTLFGGDGFSNTSSALATADALAEIPDNFTLQMQYSSDGGSNWNDIIITEGAVGTNPVTQEFEKTISTNPSAQQYSVEITNESEPAFFVAFADVRKGNTLSNYGSVDANGFTNITGTITNLAGATGGTTYKFRTLVTTTDSGYNTVNKVTATAPRTLTITDTSGDGFYIDNGDGSQTVPTGDITSVTAGDNLNGGGTSGAVTLNLNSTISGDHTFSNNVVIGGNLDVQGTTTTIDTTNLDVKDKNITLNYGTGDTSANANGAGITIQDAVNSTTDATLTWNTSNDSFNFSHPVNVTGNLKTTGNLDVDGIIDNTRNNGNVSAPNTSDHTAGTRINFYDASATSWYAMGIENSTLWFNTDSKYKWYADAAIRMTLDGANLTVTGNVTATAFYGDGSNLTGVSSTTINNNADNRIITGSGTANTLNAESGLTYNGSTLAVTGTISASGAITSSGLTVDYTGDRTGDAGILVTNDASDWGIKVDKDGTADYGILSQTDGENAVVVRNAAGVNKIQLQGDGDATFAGTISSGAITSSGNIALTSNGNHIATRNILARDTNGLTLGTTNATAAINIDNSGNVSMPLNLTVTGTINSGAITSSGTVTATNVHSDGGNLIMGDQAYSTSATYVGMKTAYQSGVNDYMIISGLSDGETYVSAKDGSATNIRGGGNNSANQIVVPDSNYISIETSNLRFSGNLQAGTTTVIDSSRNITAGTISSGAINTTSNVTLGTFSTTNTGTLILTGSTANKKAELKCTNGNLHIDSEAGNATYINYYEGTGGVFFGTGAGGHQAHINSAGGINLRGSGAAPTNSAIAVNGTSILDNSRNLTSIGTISSGAITSTGDISGSTIEGYVFPSYPSQSGGVLTSNVSGNMAWSFNTVSSYVDSGDDRIITSTGSTGIRGESNLTYNETDGLKITDSLPKLSLIPTSSSATQIILDSSVQGFIDFKHGATTDASIGYEGVFNNKLSISCGNGVTFGSSPLTTTGTISSGAITSTGILSVGSYFKAGTSVAQGFYQDSVNGAYRANGTTSTRGFWFQTPSGASTTMYVGLVGTYAGRVGVGTTTPSEQFHATGVARVGSLKIDGTEVITSGRNLTNIANISATGTGTTPFTFTGTSSSLVHKIGSATQSQYASTLWETNDGLGQIWKTGSAYTAWGGADALNIYNSNGNISFHPSATQSVLQLTSTAINATKPIQISGTTVIDASRNMTPASMVSTNVGTTADRIGNIKIARQHGTNTPVTSIDNLETFILSKTDGGYGAGTKPTGADNSTGILSFQTHTGNYYTQLALSSATNDLFIRSAHNATSYGSYSKLLKESSNITVGTISSGAITSSGALTLSADTTDCLNFSSNTTSDYRGISFNGRSALTADYNDGYLRLNNGNEFSNGVYTLGNIRADGYVQTGAITINGTTVIDASRNLNVATGASSGKFAVMSSSVHGSFDFYNNGTSYLNGSVTVDDALNISGSNRALKIEGTTVIDASREIQSVTFNHNLYTDEYGKSLVGNFGQFQAHSAYSGGFNLSVAMWGWNYVQGNTNAPNTTSNQWYRNRVSLGDQYGYNYDSNDYWLEMAYPRYNQTTAGHMWMRVCEGGGVGSWSQVGSNIIGNFVATGNVTAYSDKRLKTNIETLDSKKALQMRGVSFIKDGVEGSGVIAQEIEEIAPELVMTADDDMGTKSVAYGNLVGYLIETVKDQQKQIDELKQRLDNDSSN